MSPLFTRLSEACEVWIEGISLKVIILWEGSRRNGGGHIFFYCVEVCIFCMEEMVRPIEHQQRGRKMRDVLSYRLKLARELIGTFSSRQRVGGRPHSTEHVLLDRLNPNLGHWLM